MTSKTTTEGATTVETVAYVYNLQNRLTTVTTTPTGGSQQITEYRYNPDGIRVEKSVNGVSTRYLIDPANPTGYAQVLEETTANGANWTRIQYTLGDDVISQTKSNWGGSVWTANPTQYLLYDGHGSTRQLIESDLTITDSYSYDGYGNMLSDNSNAAANAQTSMLYCGEQYDKSSSQYYLRARYYDPANGRFNRLDPYSGNMSDPQSLHKYTYCHNNPVNGIDPSGMMYSIGGTLGLVLRIAAWTTVAVLGAMAIRSIITGRSRSIKFYSAALGPSKIREYLRSHLSEIKAAKTYGEADLQTIFEEYARLYPQVTSRACLDAAENLASRLKISLNDKGASESRKGIIFAPAALFFSINEYRGQSPIFERI